MGASQLANEARKLYMREYKKTMTEEQKQKQREYHKQWRKNNKDRVLKHQEDYWERKAKELGISK